MSTSTMMTTAIIDSIPVGWMVVKSKLLEGTYYYHHAASNTNQWHFPTLADQKRVNGLSTPKDTQQSTQAMRLEKMRQKINDARAMRDLQSRRNKADMQDYTSECRMQDYPSECKNSLILSPRDTNINKNEYKEYKFSSPSPIESPKGIYSKSLAPIISPKKSFSFDLSSSTEHENMAPSPIDSNTKLGEGSSPGVLQVGSDDSKIRVKFSIKHQSPSNYDEMKESNDEENCEVECELEDIMCY